jgi:hypothetical protein
MTSRINATQKWYILREMLELARFLTRRNVPAPQVREAVGRLRNDMIVLLLQGVEIVTVDHESYLPDTQEQP